MSAPQATTEPAAKVVCRECRSKDVRYRKRSVFDRVFSLYPYTCGRCGFPDKRFRFSLGTVVWVIFLGAFAGGGVWLRANRALLLPWIGGAAAVQGSNSTQDQTEALARARTAAGGELSTFENMMLHKPKIAMNNATVLKLVKANVGKEVILQMIRTSSPDYDLSANAVIELKEAGVDQAIILAIIDASYATH